jgi:hypothetical protein
MDAGLVKELGVPWIRGWPPAGLRLWLVKTVGRPIAGANVSAREAVRGRCRNAAAVDSFDLFRSESPIGFASRSPDGRTRTNRNLKMEILA